MRTNRESQAANRKATMSLAKRKEREVIRHIRRDRRGLIRCRVCGCTQVDSCIGGCAWVRGEPDLCTTCDDAVKAIVTWIGEARRLNRAALWREVKRRAAVELGAALA